jgi:hypothetical protein
VDQSQGRRGECAVIVLKKMRQEVEAKVKVNSVAFRQRRMKHGEGDSWPSFLTYS